MKVLLTGAGGQLGRAVRDAFAQHAVVGLDRAALDVADALGVEAALDAVRPDLVLNAAAYTAVDRAEDEPEAAYRANAEGPAVLATATAHRDLPLVHVSTDYVFDGEKGAPYVEGDGTAPLGVYGASKLAGERVVREVNPRHYVVRTAWLYGPVGRNFATTLVAAARREPALRVVDDQWGSPTYAPHLARALAALVETEAYGIHHLANAGITNRYEFVRALLDAVGLATPIEPIPTSAWPTRARRPRNTALASTRADSPPLPDWRVGVRDFAAAIPQAAVAS